MFVYKYFNCSFLHILIVAIVVCTFFIVNIIRPPQTVTVCRGSDVTISCGYRSATALPVTWIINGTSFTQQEVADSPLYQLNNPLSPMTHSLTVFSINHTTTFQCIVHSTPSTTSTLGTIYMTTCKYVCKYLVHSKQVDIVISKNQALQLSHHSYMYNHYLYCHENTLLNGTKHK